MLTLSDGFDDESEAEEREEDAIEFLEPGEYAAVTLETAEEALDFIAGVLTLCPSSRCKLRVGGNHRRAVRTNQGQPAGAKGQCKRDQSSVLECGAVRGRTRVQVAGTTEAVWQLAHYLYAHESLVEERDFGPGI